MAKRAAKPAAKSAPKRRTLKKRAPAKKVAAKRASKSAVLKKAAGSKRVAKPASKTPVSKPPVSKKPAPKKPAHAKTPASKTVVSKTPVSETSSRAKVSASSELAARKAVIATALSMSDSGLSPGRSGNVSARFGKGMLITPSGIAYDAIQPSDIVFVDGDGNVAKDAKKPSSEWQFHLSAYHARPDRGAIVHTHSLHAVVLACAHKSIPAFHYMVAIAGGDHIPLVPYAPFGTQELAEHVARGVAKIDACLMANHGQIALGGTLEQALELASEVEILAEQYVKVLTLGMPMLLRRREMKDVLERFAAYGQHAQASTGAAK